MKSTVRWTRGFTKSLVCGLAVLAWAGAARAADGVWTPPWGGNWGDSGNWASGAVASGAGSTASFRNGTSLTVNQDVPGLTLGSLYFATANYWVTGNAITLDNGAFPAVVTVGAGVADGTQAFLAVPLNGAGGVTKLGPGQLNLSAATPGALDGPVTVTAGTLFSSATSGMPFGAGSLFLNGGTLNVSPDGKGLDVALAAASGAAANTFIYGLGPSTLHLAKGANNGVALTLGNAGASAASVLVRTNSGALVIAPSGGTSGANLGAAERLLVNGGVAVNNGMVSASIVGRNNDGRDSGDFLTYGANGLVAASYTEGLGGGASSVANVTANTATDSAHVYALRVQDGKTLTINGGQTLTVGDGVHPAGVILNAVSATPGMITGGTLDFGTAEGVIYYGSRNDNWEQDRISSAIAGQNGLTLVGLSPVSEITLSASSLPYTGGTRILAGRAVFSHTGSVGGGDITVMGRGTWGGQLFLQGIPTITNTLHLSGLSGHAEGFRFGAVRVEGGGTVFSGPVELLDDARISVDGFGAQAIISGGIYGAGALEVGGDYYPMGTLALSGANTYTGGTRVNTGTLQVSTGGSLGTGPVQNGATLVFNSAAALDVANAISGAGTLVQQGPGTLKLSGTASYAGPLTVNGTLDLNGQSEAFGALGGGSAGRVVNPSGPAAVLTIGSANTSSSFSGRLEDALALVKTGAGTQTLFGTNSYRGATTVLGGALKLGNGPPVLAGLSYRLDASEAASLTRSGDNVTDWADATGNGVTFSQGTASQQPVYEPNALNGLAAIRFGDAASTRLVANQVKTVQTVFIACRMTYADGVNGIWGHAGNDKGIRARSLTQWLDTSSGGNVDDFTWQGQMYINGVAGTSFTALQPHVLTAVAAASTPWTTAIGDYWGSAQYNTRYFHGQIGEVLVYDRVLNAPERAAVEAYLSSKWLGIGTPLNNVLPATTALTVGSGASVDLDGVDQTVASLSGEGTVLNNAARGCTLTVGGDDASTVFSGGILGSITLAKVGLGTLTLYGTNSYSGRTMVQSGVLKLGGWPVTAGLSYRLDASEASSLTRSGDNVTDWADATGNGVTFSQGTASQQPVYEASAINGLPAIRFGDLASTRLVANQVKTVQTVFIACRMTYADGVNGIWGHAGNDKGIRARSLTQWLDTSSGANVDDFTWQGQMYINGAAGTSFTALQPHVLTAVAAASTPWTTAIGDYWGSAQYNTRYFHGEIGEVLVYDRVLSAGERQAVEAYLSHKWLGTTTPSRLSANADMTVAAGATLDLNGQAQTLASLGGEGSVTGAGLSVSGQTAPGGAGAVGTLSLQSAPDLSGNLLVDVRSNGTCDRLVVTGGLDVSRLALVIADTGQLGNLVYTLATCTGDLTGTFTGTNLPEKKWNVRYGRTPGAGRIQLVPISGTMVILR